MSVDSEISLLKDTVWRLTGRVLVLENFISKTFGDVLDSSWSSTPKFNTGSSLELSNKNVKRPVSRRGPQRSNITKFAKKRKCLSSSILNSSDLSSEGRIQRSVAKVSYEENISYDEDEASEQPTSTSTSIKNGMEFDTNKRIKLENVSNEDKTTRVKNGVEEWDHSGVDEEEDRDSQNTSAGLRDTTTTYQQPPETNACEPLPPPEDLPFILRGDYFKVVKLDGVKVTGECQRCPEKTRIRGSTTSTTNFLTHIKRLHPEILKIYQSQRPIPGKRRSILPTRGKSKKDKRLILGDQSSNSQSQLPVLDSSISFTSNDLSSQNDLGVAAQPLVTTVNYNVN